MIAEHYKSKQCEYYVLYLTEYHGEYPIDADIYRTPLKTNGFSARVECIWNGFEVGEAARAFGGDEDSITSSDDDKMEPMLFPDLRKTPEDPAIGHIYRLQGDLTQLNDIFTRYLREVGNGPSGGDDDTFDYWPSAFEMLWAFAKDLDKINGNKAATDDVRAAFRKILKKGNNLEWAEDEWGFDQFAQELRDAQLENEGGHV